MQEQQPIRVVVGEGRAQRQGLLGFVLEGEGMQVVATATTPAELARSLAEHRPDVVVLDDGIGSIAVSLTRQMVPGAKVVVVWPRGVVAIDGDASVEPSQVLLQLGSTIGRVMGPPPPHVTGYPLIGSGTATVVGRARGRGGADRDLAWNGARHSTVTRIHDRAERSHHPSSGTRIGPRVDARPSVPDGSMMKEHPLAEVVILPVAREDGVDAEGGARLQRDSDSSEPVVVVPEARAPIRMRHRVVLIAAAALVPLFLAASLLSLEGSRHVPVGIASAAGPVGPLPIAAQPGRAGPARPASVAVDRRPRIQDPAHQPPTILDSPTPTGTGSGTAETGGGSTAQEGGTGGGGTGGGGTQAIPGQSAARNPHGGPPGLLLGLRPIVPAN